jgi:hypothetical protein
MISDRYSKLSCCIIAVELKRRFSLCKEAPEFHIVLL